MKLGDIASKLDCELRGSPEIEVDGIAGIEEATERHLTFLGNPKYAKFLESTSAAAIIVPPGTPGIDRPCLVSKNPYLAFARAIEIFYEPPPTTRGVHPSAFVHETAVLGENCSVGAFSMIGEGVRIGKRAVIHSHVALYPGVTVGEEFLAHSHVVVRENCRIGDRVILQNGAVIGADGFGFAPRGDGSYHKIVQSGIVVLEDDVEIGACSCVDRATVGETRIGRGTKIDNLVQVGHGSTVGRDTVIAAQAGMAGSTTVGDRVMLGGQVGLAGHLEIGDDVVAIAQTGVSGSVESRSAIAGTPHMDAGLWKRNMVAIRNLAELTRTVRSLARKLESLEERSGREGG
jgi:UDP-3-O-[3-hydroxymyristoyl] glucosamine N-acyltransferase